MLDEPRGALGPPCAGFSSPRSWAGSYTHPTLPTLLRASVSLAAIAVVNIILIYTTVIASLLSFSSLLFMYRSVGLVAGVRTFHLPV